MWQGEMKEVGSSRDEQHPAGLGQVFELADLLSMDIWLGGEIRIEVSADGVITVTHSF